MQHTLSFSPLYLNVPRAHLPLLFFFFVDSFALNVANAIYDTLFFVHLFSILIRVINLIVFIIFSLLFSHLFANADSSQQLQPPRFTTQPSSSGSIVSEGRTKILQCHALGKYSHIHTVHASMQFQLFSTHFFRRFFVVVVVQHFSCNRIEYLNKHRFSLEI